MSEELAYAQLICRNCGHCPLTEEQYIAQMNRPDDRWRCLICRDDAEFDDGYFEDLHLNDTNDLISDEGPFGAGA